MVSSQRCQRQNTDKTLSATLLRLNEWRVPSVAGTHIAQSTRAVDAQGSYVQANACDLRRCIVSPDTLRACRSIVTRARSGCATRFVLHDREFPACFRSGKRKGRNGGRLVTISEVGQQRRRKLSTSICSPTMNVRGAARPMPTQV